MSRFPPGEGVGLALREAARLGRRPFPRDPAHRRGQPGIWLVDAASGNIVAAKECKDRSRASKLMAPIARGLNVVPYAACDGRSCETAVYKGDKPFKITTENVEIPLTLPMRFDK